MHASENLVSQNEAVQARYSNITFSYSPTYSMILFTGQTQDYMVSSRILLFSSKQSSFSISFHWFSVILFCKTWLEEQDPFETWWAILFSLSKKNKNEHVEEQDLFENWWARLFPLSTKNKNEHIFCPFYFSIKHKIEQVFLVIFLSQQKIELNIQQKMELNSQQVFFWWSNNLIRSTM